MSLGSTFSIKVLLVDDEPAAMDLTKLNLEAAETSFKITLAPTPKDALTLLKGESFDCIVSDYIMPEMNGIELCTEIKKTWKTPFIIYTARGSEEVASTAFSAGVDDYVRKEPNLAHFTLLARRIRYAVMKNKAEEFKAAANKELADTNIELKESYIELAKARETAQEHADKLEGIVEDGRAKLRDSEERLRKLQQMDTISRIGAVVAHDLRGPLVTISQASETARVRQELSEKMLELIAENARRSLEMIEEFREGTREVKAQKRSADLTSLVRKTVEEMTRPGNVSLDLHLGEGLNAVSLDSGLIRRVLVNLIQNGVEAMPDGGRLAVTAERIDGDAVIEVGDSGVGIRDEDQMHIFEPLFSRKKGGLGLGLYFVQMAVFAHGGVVSFNSAADKGTTFRVVLPIA